MKIEIWSDVLCPFCYIGKRRLERALAGFNHKDQVQISWKSYQLNPSMVTDPSRNINQYLAEVKGWSLEQARQMNAQVTEMAAGEGLQYDFDLAVLANSFDAHRLIQYAGQQGKGGVMEEALFDAYFVRGLNTADHQVLITLATGAGLDADKVSAILEGTDFADAVEQDIYEARQIGVRGVPYFVFDDHYAISGAQSAETFIGVLNQTWKDSMDKLKN